MCSSDLSLDPLHVAETDFNFLGELLLRETFVRALPAHVGTELTELRGFFSAKGHARLRAACLLT